MMLSVVDRPAGDHRADVIVYSTVDADDGDDGFFYVETFDVKHAAGELRSKPLGYDVSAECEAEQQAAQQLLRRDRKWGEQAL